MATKADLIYRQLFTLNNGTRVLIRPLVKEDRAMLINLFATISTDEMRFFRTKVNEPNVVGAWVDALDYEKVLPLVAVTGDRIVGDATLHFLGGPKRHMAEVRIFLAKDYRQCGLGGKMIQALIDVARRRNLVMLFVEVVADQTHIIRAFMNTGFVVKSTFEDYFMLPDGGLRALSHLVYRLRAQEDAF